MRASLLYAAQQEMAAADPVKSADFWSECFAPAELADF